MSEQTESAREMKSRVRLLEDQLHETGEQYREKEEALRAADISAEDTKWRLMTLERENEQLK